MSKRLKKKHIFNYNCTFLAFREANSTIITSKSFAELIYFQLEVLLGRGTQGRMGNLMFKITCKVFYSCKLDNLS